MSMGFDANRHPTRDAVLPSFSQLRDAGVCLDGCCSIDPGQTRTRKTNFSRPRNANRRMTLGKGSLLVRPSSVRPSSRSSIVSILPFDGVAGARGPSLRRPPSASAPGSLVRPSVRRIKRRTTGGDGVISEQSPSIKFIMVTAGPPPLFDEDDGEQEMAKQDGEEEEGGQL